ncbi:hypothetical protein LTR50_001126 [Elasticomyces elasticus]|nr:hypothetical protein LTR50_001126 [Elasticomyces elasticus]
MFVRAASIASTCLCVSLSLHLNLIHPIVAVSLPARATSTNTTDVAALLNSKKWSANTTIAYPGSAGFADQTLRWTIFDAPTYSAVITPGNEQDVIQAVKLCREHAFPFLATGGRHGYTTTLGDLHLGLAIDLSNFDRVQVDSSAATVTIGGATRASQLFDPLYEAGFMIQSGSCSCVGYVGVTLGAGVGRLQGEFGLLIDALKSVRMVTAEGKLITVSATENSELFWGIRGAGFNFGVVVSATYKLQPLINNDWQPSPSSITTVQLRRQVLLIELSNSPYKRTNTPQTQILSNWVYFGPEDEARKALAPILNAKPSTADFSRVPWNKLLATSGWGQFDASVCQKNVNRDLYATVVRNLSASTYNQAFSKMDKFFADYPNARYSSVEFEIFPNRAMLAVPNDETAYPWRDALRYVSQSYIGFSADDTTTLSAVEALAKELRTSFAATSGYPDLAVYVSYAHGDETLDQRYGANKLPRLAALKKKWDPSNVFAYNNALPTSYP